MSFEGRLARKDGVIRADITNVTEVVQNEQITADTVSTSTTVTCDQYFRAFTANNVINDALNTVTLGNF